MIKAWKEIQDHELASVIESRLRAHPQWQTFTRFTYGELVRIAKHIQDNFMRWSEHDLLDHWEGLTRFEKSCVDTLQRVTRESKLEALRKRVKACGTKTERYIRDLTAVVEKEESLRSQWDDLQSARSKIGSNVEDRF